MEGLKLKGVWVQALGFLPDAEVLEGFPVSVGSNGVQGEQGEQGLGSRDFPTQAAAFQAVTVLRQMFGQVFGQVAAGAFDHAAPGSGYPDRATDGQVFVGLEAVPVGLQEPGPCAELDLR